MASSIKHSIIVLLAITIAPALVFGFVYGKARFIGNIHALPDTNVYRSGQLSTTQLEKMITQQGIRSIINLRGGNYDEPWYQDEVSLARSLGVSHTDYALSAKREITDKQARKLLELMRTTPKPLLIHCQHGADRSGIASALYMRYIAHASREESSKQLSWRFGHLKYHFDGKDKMDISLERIESNPAFDTQKPNGK